MANTTFQRILHKYNAIVKSNAVVGAGATLQDHYETGGTFVANGASAVTIAEPKVTANSAVVITLKTPGGTVSIVAPPVIQTITPGTGFTVVGTDSDTSVYNYLVIG